MDVLKVIERQIEVLEGASSDCTSIEEKINVADAIIRLVNTSNYYLTKRRLAKGQQRVQVIRELRNFSSWLNACLRCPHSCQSEEAAA